jgi:serine/threonine-protein kinase
LSSTETLVAGRYRLERLLGRGGMAEVHLATDEQLGRPVALKILAGDGDGDFRERFRREAQAAARLSHPHVVRVFDAGEDDGRRFIVMEYVEGESLAQLLKRRGRLPAAEAVSFGLQAADGLEAAHRAGLVHRDVKPQNLLVGRDGTLKVADFGIVRAAEAASLTAHGTLLGTAAYVSPEQGAAHPVTPASDVYSLAAVLYEALTGQPPYRFESLAELVRRQQEDPIAPVRDLEPSVPAAVEDTVMRALARDPAYRPQSAAEFAGELAAAAAETPTEPLPNRPSVGPATVFPSDNLSLARARSRRARALRWALAALAALIALGVGLAIALGAGGDSRRNVPARPASIHVDPVPTGRDAQAQAKNLAAWIRKYSR